MGAYLSEPKTSKDSSDHEGDRVRCGASSMQGWRISQEVMATPPNPPKRRKYSLEEVTKAVEAVKCGMTLSAASKAFGVPKTTLHDRINNKYKEGAPLGRPSVLTPEEEQIIVDWVVKIAKAGFPIYKDQLILSVSKLIKELNRPNPFSDSVPGEKWYSLFLKRHPEIAERVSQALTTSRANVSLDDLKRWFSEVKTYLEEKNLTAVLKDSSRVFNADETAFFLCPKGNKVLAKKGEKVIYTKAGNDEKECLTVLVTANAAGNLAPPMVLFPYERLPANLVRNVPDSWGIGKSENGWMTGETFFEYMTNVFHPWLLANNIQLPVVMFIDGHSSHVTKHLSDFCSRSKIELVALYPNATHLLQPMDVAVFRPLKGAWRKRVQDWRLQNGGRKMRREEFAPILKEVLDELSQDAIINGFVTTGLLELDVGKVNFKRLLKKPTDVEVLSDNSRLVKIKEIKGHLAYLESKMGLDIIRNFNNNEISPPNVGLYDLWTNIKNEILSLEQSANQTQNQPQNQSQEQQIENETPDEIEIENPDQIENQTQDQPINEENVPAEYSPMFYQNYEVEIEDLDISSELRKAVGEDIESIMCENYTLLAENTKTGQATNEEALQQILDNIDDDTGKNVIVVTAEVHHVADENEERQILMETSEIPIMENKDAHNCILNFDKNSSLFAVYDGHGGHEVAEYCSKNLPEFIKQTESYKKGDYEQALKDAFLGFDATLATPEVIEVLKKIASGKDENKPGSDEEDGSESEEEEMNNLVQEATMPLDEVIAKYRSAGPLGRLKGEGKPPVSPMLRARKSNAGAGPSCSGAGSSKGGDGEVSSSSSTHQDIPGLCNGDAHVNGEVSELEGEGKSEAEVKVESSEKVEKAAKSESTKSSAEVTESEKVSRTEPDSSGISNGETHDVSSSSEKDAGGSGNEAISSTSPPKKKKVSSGEIYQRLLQDDSDSEEEDETFTADAESEDNSSDDVNNEAEEDEDDSSLDDEEDEDDEESGCPGFDDGKEEPGLDSGCTAVVALLVGSDLYVANAGDSRCVVSREGKAVEMSCDHKPEDEPERERIENAGGRVTNDGRVNGGLNLSRAIGDHSYKQVAPLPPQKQMITALPDVRTLSVDPAKDEFMVLACDGIWNSMTSQEVVDFVRTKLEQGTSRLSQICEELFDYCLAPNTGGDGTGCDNMTCVIVQFKSLMAAGVELASGKRAGESLDEEPESKRSKVEQEVTQTS